MTKDQAIEEMIKGERITHHYFTPDEFIFYDENRNLLDEKHCKLDETDFWQYRSHPDWKIGYSIFHNNLSPKTSTP